MIFKFKSLNNTTKLHTHKLCASLATHACNLTSVAVRGVARGEKVGGCEVTICDRLSRGPRHGTMGYYTAGAMLDSLLSFMCMCC